MCKALREALDKSGIDHNFSDCDQNPDNCDALESITGTSTYPMILILDLEDTILEIAFLADEYHQLGHSRDTQNGIRLVGNHSLDGLLNYVVNRLHLNI